MTIPNDSIFLVVCEAGDYSDYMTWVAAAYLTEAEAKAEEEKNNARAKYQRAAYYGWCAARYRLCVKKYGEKQYLWRLSEDEQAALLTWPQPTHSIMDDDYSTLEVPIDSWGEYWPK